MAGISHVANCGCLFDGRCEPEMPVPAAVPPGYTMAVPDSIDWGRWERVREDVYRRRVTHTWHRGVTTFAQWHWEFQPTSDGSLTTGSPGRWQGDF